MKQAVTKKPWSLHPTLTFNLKLAPSLGNWKLEKPPQEKLHVGPNSSGHMLE